MRKSVKTRAMKYFAGLFITVIVIAGLIFSSFIATHYSINGYVEKISGNIISVVDSTGNVWEWEKEGTKEEEVLKENSKVTIYFYDKGTTDNRTDDEILKIEKR